MLELTRRELISSAIAAAGHVTDFKRRRAQKADRLLDAGTLGRRSVASVPTDQ